MSSVPVPPLLLLNRSKRIKGSPTLPGEPNRTRDSRRNAKAVRSGTSAPKVESRTYHTLDLLQPYFSICTLIDWAGLHSFTIILLFGTIGPAIADAATFSSPSSHKLESHNLQRPFGTPAGLPFLLPPSIAAATTNLQGSTDTPIPRPRTAAPITHATHLPLVSPSVRLQLPANLAAVFSLQWVLAITPMLRRPPSTRPST